MPIEIEIVLELLDEGDNGIAAIVKSQPQGLLWATDEAALYNAIASIQNRALAAERERRRRGDKTGHLPQQDFEIVQEDDDMFALIWPELPGFGLCLHEMQEYAWWIGEFIAEAVVLLNEEEERKKRDREKK
jgi:hypothetical protein